MLVKSFISRIVAALKLAGAGIVNGTRKIGAFLWRHWAIRYVGLLFKLYAAQIGFASMVVVFLVCSAGESQAYDANQFNYSVLADSSNVDHSGFIGKPQVFIGQTILTGQTQEAFAIVYNVEEGDSISSVAARYNLSVGTIIDANNINIADIEGIKPGDKLLIPAQDTNTSTAWLDEFNRIKEEEAAKAQAEEQRRQALARQQAQQKYWNYGGYSGSGYTVIGTLRLGYNGGYPGQCTNYAHYKRPDLPAMMGNGGEWLSYARSYGIATGFYPRVGSIMVSGESWYGHVAFVESVSGGSFTVTEMNYVGPYVVSRRTIAIGAGFIKGFIY